MKSESAHTKSFSSTAPWIFGLFRGHGLLFLVLSLSALILQAVYPMLLPVLSAGVGNIVATEGQKNAIGKLATYGFAIGALLLAHYVFFSFSDANIQRIEYAAFFRNMYHYHGGEYLRKTQRAEGETYHILNAGTEGAVVIWLSTFHMLSQLLAIIGLSVFSLNISLAATAFLVGALLIYCLRMRFLSKVGVKAAAIEQAILANLEMLRTDYFTNIDLYAINLIEQAPWEKYCEERNRLVSTQCDRINKERIINFFCDVIIATLQGALVSSFRLPRTTGAYSTGEVLAVYSAFSTLQSRVSALFSPIPGIRGCKKWIDNLQEYLPVLPRWQEMIAAPQKDAITMRNVCLEIDGIPILKDINLTIQQGEKVALVGDNGSGKSTLLRVLAGVFTPVSGEVLINGQKIEHQIQIRRSIGYAPAQPQLFSVSVEENIAFATDMPRIEGNESVGVNPVLWQIAMESSGTALSEGQKMRVNIARAQKSGAGILLLDEPTSSLDPHSADQVIKMLLPLDATIVCATHDAYHATVFSRVIELKDGCILRDIRKPADGRKTDGGCN